MISGHSAAIQHYRHLISLFYIGSAGDNLNRLCSHIYLADNQLVRVRMFLNLFNLSNDNLIQIRVQLLKAFHLGSGQGHGIRIFLGRHIQIRHIHFNP